MSDVKIKEDFGRIIIDYDSDMSMFGVYRKMIKYAGEKLSELEQEMPTT